MHVGDLQHQRGMTLLEQLVTLVIAAIIAVPAVAGFLARHQLASDVNDIIPVLNYAHSEVFRQCTDTFRAWATPIFPAVLTHPAK